MPRALQGLKVLDMSRQLAGPGCAMMLGDLGADVIKIERAGVGDETRAWGPPFVNGESAYFLCTNRNKRSLTLNLKDDRGAAIARRLAEQSDVMIENFRIGRLTEMGLGYEDLKPKNPGLIYCSISGFGHTGPDQNLPGYDFMIQARGGFMSITGEPEGHPTKVGVAIADIAAGLFSNSAILAALYAREKTGRGQHIDTALLDAQIALLANVGSSALCTGEPPQRYGNAHPNVVPYQTFPTADGHFALAIGNDGQWTRFCQAAGKPEWPKDARFSTNPQRVVNRDALIDLMIDFFKGKTTSEWLALCAENDVPAGPVNTVDKVFEDPQALARGMLVEMDHPTVGTARLAGSPMNLSETPVEIRRPPPLLGEHTDEILTEQLGCTVEEVDTLRRDGVV
jgi:formyl-CoA transferase